MIHDETRLAEVITEISEWSLAQRRDYLNEIRKAFGVTSEQQLKNALTEFWRGK